MSAPAYPFISCTLERASEATGIGVKLIRQACDLGDLPCYWPGPHGRPGHKRIIRAADLDEWVQSLSPERAT